MATNGTNELLNTWGYSAVFACVLAEQLGLPLPAAPLLLAAGALAGFGSLNPLLIWLLAVAACLVGDSVWYYLGRTRGMAVLRILCKISLEPNSCVRRTNATYSKHGSRWLLFAKFIPGLSTIAPPMAGIYNVSSSRFIAMDAAGAGLWAGVFILAGWCFRSQTEMIAGYLSQLGGWVALAAGVAAAAFVLYKFIERQRISRSLRIARITPAELKQRLESGAPIMIIDLRTSFEWRESRIPGSLTFSEEELEAFLATAPTVEMIIYCSCPDEISSAAQAALRLKRAGIKSIRPLEGGFPLWTQLGFPVEAHSF